MFLFQEHNVDSDFSTGTVSLQYVDPLSPSTLKIIIKGRSP